MAHILTSVPTMRRVLWLAAALSLVGACTAGRIGGKEGSSGGPDDDASSGDASSSGVDPNAPPPPSDNVIDVAIWPRMIDEGSTDLHWAEVPELCRRMGLDLTGAVPTPAEVESRCKDRTPAEMADAFMATPEFAARELKLWMQHFRVDPTRVLADHIVDADAIARDLANGALGYDEFAAKILAHPVAALNRRIDAEHLEDSAINAFRLFMGRAPLGSETNDFVNLFRVWRRDWDSKGELGYGYYVYFATLDPTKCESEVYGPAACTSDEIGPETVMSVPLSAPVEYLGMQGAVDPDLQTELEKPGQLLALRDEFWEEAAEHALARFTGWWKSTPAEPESVVPEVRVALAAWFRETPNRDIRDLYRMIVTSLLYATTAEVSEGDPTDPRSPWSMGPTKAMESTQFLDSLEKVLERELGFCDIHTDEPIGRNFFFPDRLREAQPTDFYGFEYDFYYENGQTLGGCLGSVVEPRQPGMPALFGHIEIAKKLCAPPSVIAPAGFDGSDTSEGNVDTLATFLFERFLTRPPSADEMAAVASSADACFADPDCTMDALGTELCGALLRSGAFLFY